MIKKSLLLILILGTKLLFGQKIIVDYNFIINVGEKLMDKDVLLVFPNNESFYMTNDNYDFNHVETLQSFKSKKLTTFIKSKDDIFYELKWKVPKYIGVIEDSLKYEWEITKEEKIILGYKCYKATTSFRGRKWIAFFTYDILTDAGPWKFKKLPGLILEVSDSEGIFSFFVTKITSNKNVEIPSSLQNFFDNFEKNKIINHKMYISKENTLLEDLQSQSIASQQGLNVKTYDLRIFDLEKTFEWENEPEKP